MIAVWLVGPPRSVTSAMTSSGSRPAVSAGARSSATSTEGSAGVGTPGSGSPTRWATRRSSMSRRSVTRSAIRPAHAGEDARELLDRGVHRGEEVVVRAQVLAHGAAQPLVAGQAGAGGEHLGGGPGRPVGLALEAVGDGGDRGVVRRQGRLRVGVPAVAEGGDRVGGDLAAGEQRRPVGDAGDDRRPAQGVLGARRRLGSVLDSVRVAMLTS